NKSSSRLAAPSHFFNFSNSKHQLMRLSALVILVCSTLHFVHGQSPWVAEKGKGYAQLGYTTIGPYSDLFLSDGSSYSLTREVSDQTIQLYGEYGVGPSTSILAVLPIKLLETGSQIVNAAPIPNAAGSFSTIGNIQMAVRHNFVNDKVTLSGQMTLEVGSAGYDEATGLRGGLDATSFIPSISIGKGFTNFYFYAGIGSAFRTNDYSSDFRFGAEAGYQVLKRIYIIGVLDIVENFENGNAVETINQLQSGLYLNNQSYFAYGIKGIIGFNDSIGLTGAFYGAGSGNLVAKSPSLNVGFYFKW
ncbi:MAG TPA: hypothetical protein PKN99_10335, partial [Cyclobacteriaceae bacterium]|nr:hypothetical protein [Cyclobacteriaceae bacterium]